MRYRGKSIKLTKGLKAKIDKMTYKHMLHEWRFAPSGDILFQGETGAYFQKIMAEKRKQLMEGEHSDISKEIGWEKGDK